MASSTRVTRSKGESDRLSLPMKLRSTRRDATSGRNRGTTSTAGQEHQQQMPTQTPHTTQSPETASAEWTATAPMLPPPRRNNRNAILHQWIHRNTILLKSRLILSKLALKRILGKN